MRDNTVFYFGFHFHNLDDIAKCNKQTTVHVIVPASYIDFFSPQEQAYKYIHEVRGSIRFWGLTVGTLCRKSVCYTLNAHLQMYIPQSDYFVLWEAYQLTTTSHKLHVQNTSQVAFQNTIGLLHIRIVEVYVAIDVGCCNHIQLFIIIKRIDSMCQVEMWSAIKIINGQCEFKIAYACNAKLEML